MAGVLIHDVSGYSGSAYNLKIPSLTDTANIQEAMMLFHYGIDNFDGSVEPADASVFGNLRDFDTRIAQLEATEVVALSGTSNQITSSGSVGNVTLSIPSLFIAPGSIESTTTLSVGGSASFASDVDVTGDLSVTGTLSVTSSSEFTGAVDALAGVNIFTDSSDRDATLTSPVAGVQAYLQSASTNYVYDGASWQELITATSTSTLTNKTLSSPTLNNALLTSPEETVNIAGAAVASTQVVYLDLGTVHFYNADATATWVFDITYDASTTIDSILTTGQSISCALLVQNGATAYYPTVIKVDNTEVTPKWQGGAAPDAGNASSVDLYTFTILKTGSATFSVFAAQSQFA